MCVGDAVYSYGEVTHEEAAKYTGIFQRQNFQGRINKLVNQASKLPYHLPSLF